MLHHNDRDFRFDDKQKKIFKTLRTNFALSKKSKVQIDKMIVDSLEAYDGKNTKKTPKNRSTLVMKEIAKQIEWMKANVTEPFVSTSHPIRLTGPNQSRTRIMQKYANMQFTGQFDRESMIDQLTDVLFKEGTVWSKTEWINETRTVKKTIPSISIQRLMQLGKEPDEIEQNDDGTFKVEFHTEVEKKNHPTMVIQRNENVFPDATARTRSEMQWIMVRRYDTVSEMRMSGNYNESILEKLAGETEQNTSSSLASGRNKDDLSYGYDSAYRKANEKKISIIEFWGMEDIHGNKKPIPIRAEWAEHQEIDLLMEENPNPSKEIPFQVAVYSSRPFSIWGNSLAFFLKDSQALKSGMYRGIVDNLSNANNGQTFIAKGAMDYVNFKRWQNGERHILVNKSPAETVYEGKFNNLPPSIFSAIQMVDQEVKQLSGVQAGGPALSNDGMAKDDTGGMNLTMAQQRSATTVRAISNMLSKVVREWIMTAERWLNDEQIQAMFTESEVVDLATFRDSEDIIATMSVGTEASRTIKTQQINMLMQQSKVLEDNLPPEQLNKLTAEMYELFDMYEDAEQIRNYQRPEPTEKEMLVSNLKVEKLELENKLIQAQVDELNSRTQDNQANAVSTVTYKQAQTEEKLSKVRKNDAETAFVPLSAMNEIEKTRQSGQKGNT